MLERRRRVQSPNATSPWPFVGMALIVAAFFPYAASGLVAPWWGVVVLLLVWLVLFLLCCAWWSPRPTWLVGVGVFAFVFWFAALNVGARWFGWSA